MNPSSSPPWTRLFREFHAVTIPVPDLASARDWYEHHLGLRPARVSDDGFMVVYGLQPTVHLCLFRAPGGEGTAAEQGEATVAANDAPRLSFNLRTDDARATHRLLDGAGVPCTDVRVDGPITWFSLTDPFGHVIGVCEYGDDWLPQR